MIMLIQKALSAVQSVLIFKALSTGVGKVAARATDIALAGKVSKSSHACGDC